LDRWYVNTTGGTGSVAQTGSVGSYGLQVTGASGVSSAFFGQKIESYNIADLAGQTITYSITLSSSTLTSITWYARYPTAQDNYTSVTLITSGSITINSTPTQYTFQIALPSGAANGLEVYFLTGAFTSGTLTAKFAQVEVGTTATNFEYRSIGTELALCQRYFQVAGRGYGYARDSSSILINYQCIVTMRAMPSLALTTASPYIENVPWASIATTSGCTVDNGHMSVYGGDVKVSGSISGISANQFIEWGSAQLLISSEL